jgi:lactoylglutathione lyase
METKMITDLGHTAFRVHDLDKTLAFYEILGIREAFRLHREDGSLMLIYLHVDGERFIEIFPNGPKPGSPSGSYFHLCLQTDDIEADVANLKAQGITITQEIKTGLDHNLQAWLKVPDGNPIELMQLSETSPQYQIAHVA